VEVFVFASAVSAVLKVMIPAIASAIPVKTDITYIVSPIFIVRIISL
jgi:hypothetical protein